MKCIKLSIVILLLSTMASLGQEAIVKVPRGKPFKHDIRPGPGVTSVRWLSRYNPAVAKTPGDTRVYILEGKERGGTVVVVGGTHSNEIAGIMAATVLVEHARVLKGRLIVIPNANNSAVSYTDPQRPGPEFITVPTSSGQRRFKYGARLTRPEHQGQADPPKYHHPRSDEMLESAEARNLDRAYPGQAKGNLTERIAYGILEVIRSEGADIAFDLHEAGPESRLAWMVVANPKNVDTAALAIVNLDAAGIPMKLEPSSETFRGLSHREWGDATKAQAFLFETPSPTMVSNPRGADTLNDPKYPLARRTGVHLSTFMAVVDAYNELAKAELAIRLQDVPGWPEISKAGLKSFLK
jgi:predicted deacylase